MSMLCLTLALAAEPTRDHWLRPFAADSVWNTPIGDGAAYVPANLGRGARIGVDEEWLIQVPAGTPSRPLFAPAGWESRAGGTRWLAEIPLPDALVIPDARKWYTPNCCTALLLPDGRTVEQLAPVCRPVAGGPAFGYRFDRVDLWGDGTAGSHGASRLGTLGGSLRLGELLGDEPIGHVLKINVFCEKLVHYDAATKGYRWPATGADSYAAEKYRGKNPAVRMGCLFALPPDAKPQKLGITTAPGRKLFNALQNYGAYLVDDSAWDSYEICAERGVEGEVKRVTGLELTGDKGPLVADIQTLVAALCVIDNNSPGTVGGGGKRRAKPPASLPPEPARPVPAVANGSMDAGTDVPEHWGDTWAGSGKLKASRDTTTFRKGPASLRLESVGGKAEGQVQHFLEAKAGDTVRVGGYFKSAGKVTARVGVVSYTADWKGNGFTAFDQVFNDSDWRPWAGEAKLPPGTARCAVVLMLNGDGRAWLDEVTSDPKTLKSLEEAKKSVKPAQPADDPHRPAKAANAWSPAEGYWPDYPRAWRQVAQSQFDRTKKGDIDLIFLGDSITQGWGDHQNLWDKHFGHRRAVNYGIGGDGTPQVLWRLGHGLVDGIQPKAIVLMIGTNNRWMGGQKAADFERGIAAVVTDLRKRLPETRVLLLGIFPTGEQANDGDRKLFADVNARLAKLDDGNRVWFRDLSAVFIEADGTISRKVMPDTLHLSAEGYRRWAEALEPALKEVLGEK